MHVIDLFQSLMFDLADSLSVEPISLQYLGLLNLQSCIRGDTTGCEIVDRTTLLNLLSAAKRTMHAQGGVATSAQNDRLW
jgi:nuclear pore complex protein Nup205